MIGRLALIIVAVAAGVSVATFVPGLSQSFRYAVGLASGPGVAQLQGTAASAPELRTRHTEPDEEKPALVKLTQDQITAAHIDLTTVRGATLARRITVPGTVVPHADRIARVSVRLSAIVSELRKKIGDPVAKDEILAILESREVADAKSEYLAARLTDELQQDLFQRDKMLWDKRVSNEQQFLRSRNAAAQTRMRLDIARQKLLALGLAQTEIAALPEEPEGSLRRQAIRSPIAGRVVERKVDLGTAVGRDNLETELFVIVDLDRVWVELAISPADLPAISPADLPAIKEGQPVSISARTITEKVDGKIVFISPLLDKETRSAHVIAEIANGDGVWRPGSFVTAAIAVEEQAVPLVIPTSAVQTIDNEKVVFVRTPEGFERHPVGLGRNDDRLVEVVTGLRSGEVIAVTNTFSL
ncbi:MAG: efflux RND transporter periplasmic adaptor subunit, partial [Alphaproteobacteria bacterium]